MIEIETQRCQTTCWGSQFIEDATGIWTQVLFTAILSGRGRASAGYPDLKIWAFPHTSLITVNVFFGEYRPEGIQLQESTRVILTKAQGSFLGA